MFGKLGVLIETSKTCAICGTKIPASADWAECEIRTFRGGVRTQTGNTVACSSRCLVEGMRNYALAIRARLSPEERDGVLAARPTAEAG